MRTKIDVPKKSKRLIIWNGGSNSDDSTSYTLKKWHKICALPFHEAIKSK